MTEPERSLLLAIANVVFNHHHRGRPVFPPELDRITKLIAAVEANTANKPPTTDEADIDIGTERWSPAVCRSMVDFHLRLALRYWGTERFGGAANSMRMAMKWRDKMQEAIAEQSSPPE